VIRRSFLSALALLPFGRKPRRRRKRCEVCGGPADVKVLDFVHVPGLAFMQAGPGDCHPACYDHARPDTVRLADGIVRLRVPFLHGYPPPPIDSLDLPTEVIPWPTDSPSSATA
jgi:hypothetical protein